jgi:hypothetical protein
MIIRTEIQELARQAIVSDTEKARRLARFGVFKFQVRSNRITNIQRVSENPLAAPPCLFRGDLHLPSTRSKSCA